MTNNQRSPKYDLRGAQFAGGMAETVEGDQIGGSINNYGTDLDTVSRLLSSLRLQTELFPLEHKTDALDVIDDIEANVKKAEVDSQKMGRRLKRLLAIASIVAVVTGGAADFSEHVTDFTNNVIELTEVLSIPLEKMKLSENISLPENGS